VRGAAILVGAVIVAAGCVDHQANARAFCDRHAALLSVERDGAHLAFTADELADIEDEIERSMRDAEDGTRPVRLAARDLVAAYDELASLVDDDDTERDELAGARADLLEARTAARDACALVTREQ